MQNTIAAGMMAGVSHPSLFAQDQKPPNILWINAEDMSPALGCYGDKNATTPNIDQLATESIQYNNAFSTAPICAPSRSCLITGLYATALGTQHLRCEVTKPDFIKTFPEYLKASKNYFCTCNGKTDFNFDPNGIWDYWKKDDAPWRQRTSDEPFFTLITIGTTHEGPTNRLERYKELTKDLPKELFHNPDDMEIPLFYPDTPEIRQLCARMYDLITVMDRQVGSILQNLKDDGLDDDTIVVFFADHGNGLPRYKRWLNDSGLRVPLMIRFPDKYQHLTNLNSGSQTYEMVSFVDYAPTMLRLAGVDVPDHMQGNVFLGDNRDQPREYIYGARSRADDMYETSRSVQDDRYFYVRHYLPHLPYIQSGVIFSSEEKMSFKILRELHEAGKLPPHAEALWADRKPMEELYDLQEDPHEINNLADSKDHQQIKDRLKLKLNEWIIEHRDTGFLHEAEYHIRGSESTIYEMMQDQDQTDLPAIVAAAELVGDQNVSITVIQSNLNNQDSGVRYWGAIAALALQDKAKPLQNDLETCLNDSSPSVQIAAAEALCAIDEVEKALPVLERIVDDDRPWVALYAARTIQLIGTKAKPLVPVMKKVLEKNKGEAAGGRYKDYNYAAFTSWALEVAIENCS